MKNKPYSEENICKMLTRDMLAKKFFISFKWSLL